MKKSEYTRSTVERRYDEMKPAFIKIITKYAEEHKLGNIENEILNCFETANLKKGFFGKIKTNYTEICITKRFLFWGVFTDKDEQGVGAAQWTDISEVREWKDSDMSNLIEESGVEMLGFLYRASSRGTWFIGLGNDDAGRKCTALFKVIAAKNSNQSINN
ncbi:MAG: hypothetical protein PHN88_07180 [Ignavibacteria bacterium]|nr:hypothetical protein [Ignavibacteria bacterium]